jgi:hypothetical protein
VQIPENVFIAKEKLTRYLLVPRRMDDKSGFLAQAGFTRENPSELEIEMKPQLYQRVVLTKDLPEENLRKGDLAWLVDYVSHPDYGEEGAVLELFNVMGDSIAVVTVPVSAIADLTANLVPVARPRAMA